MGLVHSSKPVLTKGEIIKVENGICYYEGLTDDLLYVQKGGMLIFVFGKDYLVNRGKKSGDSHQSI